jgi:cytochrome o ubiquinol oxidase subunit 2
MAEINNKRQSHRWPAWILILPFIDFLLFLRYLLRGKNIALFNSKGFVANEQRSLIVFTMTLLFAVAIPTLFLLFFIAWKYRESNPKAVRTSKASRIKSSVLGVWLVPITIMLILVPIMWPATHELAPQKAITAATKPMTIQVISLRWKWVFIYPEQKIATVNFAQLPVNTPITFEMTADEAPMSSFWIPNLGGQLYTMTSHVNRLNLMADTLGDYPGSTPEINGNGFSGMKFTARVSSTENFNNWVETVKQSPNVLDQATYQKLLEPSEYEPSKLYAAYEPNLYDKVILKYEGPGGHSH